MSVWVSGFVLTKISTFYLGCCKSVRNFLKSTYAIYSVFDYGYHSRARNLKAISDIENIFWAETLLEFLAGWQALLKS
jgi:hypothetical protein